MDRPCELDLARREVLVDVVGQLFAEHENAVERRAQLMRHVREELGLVPRRERELRGLLLDRAPRELDLGVLALDLRVLRGEELSLLGELLVRLLELPLLRLLLEREPLGLLEQKLRAHRDLDVVEHDADDVGELLEQRDVLRGELAQARELDDRFDGALEQHRQHDDGPRLEVDEAGRDPHRARRQVLEHDSAALVRALPDQAFVERVLARVVAAAGVGVSGELLEPRSAVVSAIT